MPSAQGDRLLSQSGNNTTEAVFPPEIVRAGGDSDVILVCEHAANHFPKIWGDLGLRADQKISHAAWDPGALAVALGLSERLDATLIHATVSRLIYDLNRAPDMPGAMPAKSEVHEIPGNAGISHSERLARTKAVYIPWTNALHDLVAERIALGRRPVIVTIHSFTPIYFGQARSVEFGVIHDADPRLSAAILNAAKSATGLNAALNAPYSAKDDVTHTLRLHATPYGLDNTMLEIRNDLIATPEDQAFMADQLTQVINMGLAEIQKQAKAS